MNSEQHSKEKLFSEVTSKAKTLLNELNTLNLEGEVFGSISLQYNVYFTSQGVIQTSSFHEAGYAVRYTINDELHFLSMDDANRKHLISNLKNSKSKQSFAYPSTMTFRNYQQQEFANQAAWQESSDITITNLIQEIDAGLKTANQQRSPLVITNGFYSSELINLVIFNSHGLTAEFEDRRFHLKAILAALDKDQIIYQTQLKTIQRSPLNISEILVEKLKAAQPYLNTSDVRKNKIWPVILSTKASTELADQILRPVITQYYKSYNRAENHIDKSKLQLNPNLSLIEEANNTNRIAARPFDAEGTPTQNIHLIHEGKPHTIPKDSMTAARENSEPTGNVFRGLPEFHSYPSYRELPQVGLSNLKLTSSNPQDLKTMIEDTKVGFFIDGIGGVEHLNILTGDFAVISYSGRYIHKGSLQKGTGRITIYDNIFELLDKIILISDNTISGYFSEFPSIKLEHMRIEGN